MKMFGKNLYCKSKQLKTNVYIQVLLKIVKAKNRFKSKRAARLQQDQIKKEEEEAIKRKEEARIAEEEREEASAKQNLIVEKKIEDYFSDTESELSESDLWNSTKSVTIIE